MIPFVLGLSASLCWGVADFLGGIEAKRLPGALVVLVSQAVGASLLVIVAVASADLILSEKGMAAAAVAGVAGAIGITSFYRALSIGTMSIVAPIAATGAIVPVIIGLLEGERPTSLQTLGMAAAGIGVVLATQEGDIDAESKRISRQSIVLALVAATCIGVTLAALDRAAESGVIPALLWTRLVSITVLLGVVAATIRPPIEAVRANFAGLALIGILDLSATALFAVATTHGLLSIVAVASSLYPVATVILARMVLAERVRPVQATGVTIALAGVALLATR